ncbi:sensor histidine kinase [Salinarimonas ramus]|uniref:histidine kinase n=1 Tax=Salinarimonas ramus TaxID=690164 RepID=A0A917QC87_9HYPH|nr:ATP-binding protein [Salinarimonas ramus]GGK42785.1 histidine kinase [Salinarimonas ramus]
MRIEAVPAPPLLRLFDATAGLRAKPRLGYGVALAGFLVALALRLAVGGALVGYPYITFFPVVVVTTFLGGVRPGLFAATICGLAAWYWFIPPERSFALLWPSTAIALAFYVLVVGVEIALIHLMELSRARYAAEEARARALLAEQRTLFHELQHRVSNNMAFVAALLTLQRRHVGGDPAALAALDAARARLDVMGRIHRRLYDPDAAQAGMDRLLVDLCDDVVQAVGVKGVGCAVEAERVTIAHHRLLTLALIATEIVTNALKHAYPDGGPGEIRLSLGPDPAGGARLVVADDGSGLPESFAGTSREGLGMRIVAELARQLEATIAWERREPGTAVVVRFPEG